MAEQWEVQALGRPLQERGFGPAERPGRPAVSLMRSQQTELGVRELKEPALLHPNTQHTSN